MTLAGFSGVGDTIGRTHGCGSLIGGSHLVCLLEALEKSLWSQRSSVKSV